MDLATVNVIALLFGVIFLTSLLIAAIKIVRSRHDAQSLGNRSVKVPLNDESAVFDPTSSGLDGYNQEKTQSEQFFADQVEIDDVIPEPATAVTEIATVPSFASDDLGTEEVTAKLDETEDVDSEVEALAPEFTTESTFASDDSETEEIFSKIEEAEDVAPESATVVAEIAGEPIYASDDSDIEDDFQEIEVVENTEEAQVTAEDSEEEPTGAIAEGLIEEFLGSRDPEVIEVEATEIEVPFLEEDVQEFVAEQHIDQVEPEASDIDASEIEDSEIDAADIDASEIEDSEIDAADINASEIENSEIDAADINASEVEDSEIEAVEIDASESENSEIDAADINASEIEDSEIEAVEIDPSEIENSEIDEIEDYFDPDQPAFAARASVPTSTTPLFKVAPPSVPDEAPDVVIADELDSEEVPSAENIEVDEPVTTNDESIAYDATVPIGKIDITLDATVPIAHPEQPAPNYSFEEVPEVEVIEDEVILGADITNQISQLDTDLDTIEELVREIELSLADFEPLSGFEDSDEEKAA